MGIDAGVPAGWVRIRLQLARAAREDLEASEQPVQVSSQLVGGRDTQALMGMAEVTRQPAWPASTLTLIVRPES